jgi:hypothetical protein
MHRASENRTVRIIATTIAMVAMLPLGFFMLSSGLLAPLWAVIVFMLLWAFGLLMIWRLPALWRLAVPLVVLAIWWAGLSLGGALLGWTP